MERVTQKKDSEERDRESGREKQRGRDNDIAKKMNQLRVRA